MTSETERTDGAGRQVRSPCCVEVVSTEAGMLALEAEWSQLLKDACATVFQSFEWVTAWWTHFHEGRELHCLSFRKEGRLVGLALLYRREIRILHTRLCTVLEFVGHPHADYQDFLVLPGFEEDVLDALLEHLASGAAGADIVTLEEIPPFSRLRAGLVKKAGLLKMRVVVTSGPVCPFISLPPTFEEFLRTLGPNTRYNYRRKHSKLVKQHSLAERVISDAGNDLDEGLESFMRIHSERWKGLGFPSVFDDPVHRRFFKAVTERFAARGWLRLYLLRADGVDVAASLEFAHGGRVYMYNSNASGPLDVMRCSPGLLVKLFAIREAIGERMREYDMLRGDEKYKYDNLKAGQRFNTTIRIALPVAGGRLRFRLFLGWLFANKAVARMRLEYHEWRRFTITKQPGTAKNISYFTRRTARVAGMAAEFISVNVKRR